MATLPPAVVPASPPALVFAPVCVASQRGLVGLQVAISGTADEKIFFALDAVDSARKRAEAPLFLGDDVGTLDVRDGGDGSAH